MTITPSSVFNTATAATRQLPPELILGSLVWYQVSETRVAWTTVEQNLKAVGLSEYCPKAPRDEDVFRRVAPNGHIARTESSADPNIHFNYLIRQVRRGGGDCVKHIVVETVDKAGETLGFDDVLALKYTEARKTMEIEEIIPNFKARQLADDILGEFNANKGFVDDNALRAIIRKVFDGSRATNVRPNGGVYFVMAQYRNLVNSLERFCDMTQDTFVHSLPLVDDGKQKEMLRRAYEEETISDVDKMMEEITALLGSKDEVTPKQFARFNDRAVLARGKHSDYQKLLSDSLDSASSKLDILNLQMRTMFQKVAG